MCMCVYICVYIYIYRERKREREREREREKCTAVPLVPRALGGPSRGFRGRARFAFSLWRRGATWCYIRRLARSMCEKTESAVRCDMVFRRAFRASRL